MATSHSNIESMEPVTSNNKESAENGLNSYELRWNGHIPYFTSVFQSLHDLNELTDVTFACEDGIVGAHKLVLSSCSVYLRILFARLGTPHPVIFLKNTPVSLVRHVLEFIYCGSVNVSKEELALVLSLGHSLQIHGLTKLKLSGDNDSSGDIKVDNLEKEIEVLQEQIASESPILPGEVKKSPTYSLNNGKEIEFDSKNNSYINKTQMNQQPKPSSKIIQNQRKKIKQDIQEQNCNPNNLNQKKSTQKKMQNLNHKSKTIDNRIRTKIKQENGSKFKHKSASVADIKADTKALTDIIANLRKFMPQKKAGFYRYDPRLRMMLGKYYVDHGVVKAREYFEKSFGFKVPQQSLWTMKKTFLDNHQKLTK